uniref:Uncharacterized protein n=1 Tax=Borely moumouvirus TaxID=2712067 RepID=A0A6G6ACK8_9VIRU
MSYFTCHEIDYDSYQKIIKNMIESQMYDSKTNFESRSIKKKSHKTIVKPVNFIKYYEKKFNKILRDLNNMDDEN